MARKLNILATGSYPVYEGRFADGTVKRLSFPTCAKKFAKDRTIEFENGRRLVSQVKNPPTVFDSRKIRFIKIHGPAIPLVAGVVHLSATESIIDPMTDTITKKRTTVKQVKAVLIDLIQAVETGKALPETLETARKIAA